MHQTEESNHMSSYATSGWESTHSDSGLDESARRLEEFAGSKPATSLPTKVGFYFMLAFLFFFYSRILDFFLPYLHLPFIVSCIAFLMVVLTGAVFKIFKSTIGRLLVLFSVWLCLAIPTSVWRGGSIQTVTDEWLKSLAAFLIVGGLIASFEDLKSAINVLALALLFAATLVLAIGVSDQGRLTLPLGLYSGPNEVAMAMLTGCVVWWWKVAKPSSSLAARLFSVLCLFPILYVIPKTASRGGLVVALLLFPFILLRKMGRGRPLVLLVLIVGIVSASFLLPQQLRERFATLLPASIQGAPTDTESAQVQEEARGSTEERWYLLKTSIAITLKNPIFGIGPGQFEVAEDSQASSAGQVKGTWRGTHNTYTQLSSEAGIPALLFFVFAMGWCWRELVRIEKRCKNDLTPRGREILITAFALRALLLVEIVFFAFAHLGYEAFFPTLAGLVFALSRVVKAELPEPAVEPAAGRQIMDAASAMTAY